MILKITKTYYLLKEIKMNNKKEIIIIDNSKDTWLHFLESILVHRKKWKSTLEMKEHLKDKELNDEFFFLYESWIINEKDYFFNNYEKWSEEEIENKVKEIINKYREEQKTYYTKDSISNDWKIKKLYFLRLDWIKDLTISIDSDNNSIDLKEDIDSYLKNVIESYEKEYSSYYNNEDELNRVKRESLFYLLWELKFDYSWVDFDVINRALSWIWIKIKFININWKNYLRTYYVFKIK